MLCCSSALENFLQTATNMLATATHRTILPTRDDDLLKPSLDCVPSSHSRHKPQFKIAVGWSLHKQRRGQSHGGHGGGPLSRRSTPTRNHLGRSGSHHIKPACCFYKKQHQHGHNGTLFQVLCFSNGREVRLTGPSHSNHRAGFGQLGSASIVTDGDREDHSTG